MAAALYVPEVGGYDMQWDLYVLGRNTTVNRRFGTWWAVMPCSHPRRGEEDDRMEGTADSGRGTQMKVCVAHAPAAADRSIRNLRMQLKRRIWFEWAENLVDVRGFCLWVVLLLHTPLPRVDNTVL